MSRFANLLLAALLAAPLPVLAARPRHVAAAASVRLALTPDDGEDAGPDLPDTEPSQPAPPTTPETYTPRPPPEIHAAAAALVDAHTGQTLFQHNAPQRRRMASTAKIRTATLIPEAGHPDDVVTVGKHAAVTPYGSLHLRPGEKLPRADILYGI